MTRSANQPKGEHEQCHQRILNKRHKGKKVFQPSMDPHPSQGEDNNQIGYRTFSENG